MLLALLGLSLATVTEEKKFMNDEYFKHKIFPSFDSFIHILHVFFLFVLQLVVGAPLFCISALNLIFFIFCKVSRFAPKRKVGLLDSYILNSVVMCMNLSNIILYLIYNTVALFSGCSPVVYPIVLSVMSGLFEYFVIERSIRRKEKRRFSYDGSIKIISLFVILLFFSTLQQFTPGFGILKCFVSASNIKTFLYYLVKAAEHIALLIMSYVFLIVYFPPTKTESFFDEENIDKINIVDEP